MEFRGTLLLPLARDLCRCVLLLTALSFTLACASLLRLENNAYTGIVVAIAPAVDETHADRLIRRIKEVFTDSSPILHAATKRKSSFGDVTIVIPRSWKNTTNDGLATYETFLQAQVRIDTPHPAHGHVPYTRQPRGCGAPGDYIHMTPDFLLNSSMESAYGNAAKILVHEWAHLRYGVFDEYGFPGDRRFPHVYWDDEAKTPKPTGCNDSHVYGESNFDKEECKIDPSTGQYGRQCRFTPERLQSGVSSSLMYLHYLPQVQYFCDETTHNPNAPNQQNAFCNGQSVTTVIERHTDFIDVSPTTTPAVPKFRVLQAQKDKLVIVLDASRAMNDNQRFEFLKTAMRLLLNELLPDGLNVGIVIFKNNVDLISELKPLDVEWRNGLRYALDNKAAEPSPDYTNWSVMYNAIRRGQELLGEGGTLLLITAGYSDTASGKDKFSQLCSQLQTAGVRVASLLYSYPDQPSVLSKTISALADKTNGMNFYVYEQSPGGYTTYPVVLTQLMSALAAIVGQVNGDEDQNFVMVKEASSSERSVTNTFYIDENIGRNLTVMFIPQDKKGTFTCTLRAPNGALYNFNNYTDNVFHMSEEMHRFLIRDAQAGEWRYHVETSNDFHISIFITSHKKTITPIRIRAWTSAGNAGINASKEHVILYAEVKQGHNPVINARVIAKVQRPSPRNGDVTIETIPLYDSGNGDPDTTKGDGIYARYFTNFVNINSSHYLVTVSVDDNDGAARVVTTSNGNSGIIPLNSDDPYCCGSEEVAANTSSTGNFSRYANAGTFFVVQAPLQGDHSPPGRIGDFQIRNFWSHNMTILLEWTAPGNDFDRGNASSYEVRYSSHRQSLLDAFDMASEASNIPEPKEAGTIQQMTITHRLDFEAVTFHYAIRAVDADGNRGALSNIVTVQYPAAFILPTTKPTSTPNNGTSTSGPVPPTKAKLSTAEMIGLIVGCVVMVLFIFIVIVIIIIVHRKRRQKTQQAEKGRGDPKRPNMFVTPAVAKENVKNTNYYGNGHALPPTDSALSPVQFMSASELLEKHELQKSQYRSHTPSLHDEMEHQQQQPMYHPTTVMPTDKYIIPYTPFEQQHPMPGMYVSAMPYRDSGSIDRGSFSDKHSSSFTSGSTNELRKDNGYFTSLEETSEDSSLARQTAPGMLPAGPMSSSKTSLARKTVSESQV